jgi:hypothetical protein
MIGADEQTIPVRVIKSSEGRVGKAVNVIMLGVWIRPTTSLFIGLYANLYIILGQGSRHRSFFLLNVAIAHFIIINL